MGKDLRSYLELLKEKAPEEIAWVDREVSTEFEPIALISKLDKLNLFPAVFFKKLKGHSFPVIANVLSNRKKYALALDTTPEGLIEEIGRRELTRVEPKLVKTGPVKEVKMVGGEVDLYKFPILKHSEKDDAPYVTMGITICKDPDSGARNLGIYRHKLIGKDRLGLYYSWAKHIHFIHRKVEMKGEPLEVAIVIGMHPALYVASQALVSAAAGDDEFCVAGGMLGEPLEVVKCETVDLEVPAGAEIVIEGELRPNERQTEGPFGEYTRYYGQIVDAPMVRVKAITHRKDAIYQDVGIYLEHITIPIVMWEGNLLRELRRLVPTVKAVHIPTSGVMFNVYISLEKVNEGDAKTALMAALCNNQFLKHAIAVDADIDVYNEREVLWAVATRMRGDRDIFMVPGATGNRLDPTAFNITRLSRDSMVTKVGIDATTPLGLPYPLPEPTKVPGEDEIKIDDYIRI